MVKLRGKRAIRGGREEGMDDLLYRGGGGDSHGGKMMKMMFGRSEKTQSESDWKRRKSGEEGRDKDQQDQGLIGTGLGWEEDEQQLRDLINPDMNH